MYYFCNKIIQINVWKGFFIDIFKHLNNVHQHILTIFNSHMTTPSQIDRVFGCNDPFVDNTHEKHCCDMTSESAICCLNWCSQHELNDGMSSSSSYCYCGNKMNIIRLRSEFSRYRVCHCGKKFGYLTYFGYNYLGVCSNVNCLCTHEVNKQSLQPLGKPCNMFCKNLRLHVHELIDRIVIKKGISKTECYKKISTIVNKSEDATHMAKLEISDCIKILLNLQNDET